MPWSVITDLLWRYNSLQPLRPLCLGPLSYCLRLMVAREGAVRGLFWFVVLHLVPRAIAEFIF